MVATYATYAQMVRRYGTAALTALIPTDSGSDLETLAGDALVEAAAEIDGCLGAASYTTPVDTSAITDADQQARSAAMLRRIEIGLAVAALGRQESEGIKAESSAAGSITYGQMSTDASLARKQLAEIASGRLAVPGVSQPGRVFVYSSAASVPSRDDVTDRLEAAGGW